MLKPGGTFHLQRAVATRTRMRKWTEISLIGGGTIYSEVMSSKTFLENAGFCNVQIHKKQNGLALRDRDRNGRNKECHKPSLKDWGWGAAGLVCTIGIRRRRCPLAHLYDLKVHNARAPAERPSKTRCVFRLICVPGYLAGADLRVCRQRCADILGRACVL